MLPVLLTIANHPITSFGLFLVLSFSTALYAIWRVSRLYELDAETIFDLFFLTLIAGFLGARIYYILFHLPQFDSLTKLIFINRYPGISFWGGFFVGILILRFLSYRFKVNFWQIADFAIVGLFIAIAFSNIGCLLGSCQYGVVSNSFLAVDQIGVIGKRFPIQAFEAVLFFLGFWYLWKQVLKFHSDGQIAGIGLMILGSIKFCLEFLRSDVQLIPFLNFSLGFFWSIITIIWGLVIYYAQTKKSFKGDLLYLASLPVNSNRRKLVVSKLYKSCYNLLINFKFKLKRGPKSILKALHIRSNPTKFS